MLTRTLLLLAACAGHVVAIPCQHPVSGITVQEWGVTQVDCNWCMCDGSNGSLMCSTEECSEQCITCANALCDVGSECVETPARCGNDLVPCDCASVNCEKITPPTCTTCASVRCPSGSTCTETPPADSLRECPAITCQPDCDADPCAGVQCNGNKVCKAEPENCTEEPCCPTEARCVKPRCPNDVCKNVECDDPNEVCVPQDVVCVTEPCCPVPQCRRVPCHRGICYEPPTGCEFVSDNTVVDGCPKYPCGRLECDLDDVAVHSVAARNKDNDRCKNPCRGKRNPCTDEQVCIPEEVQCFTTPCCKVANCAPMDGGVGTQDACASLNKRQCKDRDECEVYKYYLPNNKRKKGCRSN